MNYRILLSFLASVSLIISGIITGPGCANIVPPQGGPRDSIPPRLIKANPHDSATNFSGNKISFSFDDYVDVQNIQENLLVSPTPKINPVVEFKLNTVTVRLKDSLETNTTYILNFGNAIKDFNEGNILKDFTYVFSTGARIDSMELHGKVILAQDGKIDSTIIVMLHKNGDDSAVVKEKPRYIAKLNGNGEFIFKNLPPGIFYLYALKDESGTRRYQNIKQLFAFADKQVNITAQKNEPVTLYAFADKQETKQPVISLGQRRVARETEDKRLRWKTNLANNLQDLQDDLVLSFDVPLRSFDSSKLRLLIDSTFTPVAGPVFLKDSTNKKIQLHYDWQENKMYHLVLDKEFAEDSSGKKLLKSDTLHFASRKKEDYGSLVLNFNNLDLTKNPVLLFIQGEEIKKSFPLTAAAFSQPLFVPGEYQMGILNDINKNGRWDPGEFLGKHKQPEIVKPVSRHITVKADTENEFEINL